MPFLVRALRSRPACALYLLTAFMLPWPGLGRAYTSGTAEIAAVAFDGTNPSVTLRFSAPPGGGPKGGAWQLYIFAEDKVTGSYIQTALDLRRGGYIALAVFVALILATRTRWTKKLAVLGSGLPALQVLPLLPLLSFFSGKLPVRVFQFGPVTRTLIDIVYHTLVALPGMAYAVPALLWLLLVWLFDSTSLRLPRATATPATKARA